MSTIKEIRELTGLSQYKIAEWLGVSRGLINLAEMGKRELPHEAFMKITAMTLLLEQMKGAGKAGKAVEMEYTDPAKLGARHKKKMEFHERSAIGLKIQLRKLRSLHPQINNRLDLLAAMKDHNTEWYSATEKDKTWIEMIEWFTKERMNNTGLEEQDLLKDKIETHLAYAELHKQRWEKFSSADKNLE